MKFSAMRFQGNDPDAEREEWVLTVDGYCVFDGIRIPSEMKATWKLDAGDWTWQELEILNIEYDL